MHAMGSSVGDFDSQKYKNINQGLDAANSSKVGKTSNEVGLNTTTKIEDEPRVKEVEDHIKIFSELVDNASKLNNKELDTLESQLKMHRESLKELKEKIDGEKPLSSDETEKLINIQDKLGIMLKQGVMVRNYKAFLKRAIVAVATLGSVVGITVAVLKKVLHNNVFNNVMDKIMTTFNVVIVAGSFYTTTLKFIALFTPTVEGNKKALSKRMIELLDAISGATGLVSGVAGLVGKLSTSALNTVSTFIPGVSLAAVLTGLTSSVISLAKAIKAGNRTAILEHSIGVIGGSLSLATAIMSFCPATGGPAPFIIIQGIKALLDCAKLAITFTKEQTWGLEYNIDGKMSQTVRKIFGFEAVNVPKMIDSFVDVQNEAKKIEEAEKKIENLISQEKDEEEIIAEDMKEDVENLGKINNEGIDPEEDIKKAKAAFKESVKSKENSVAREIQNTMAITDQALLIIKKYAEKSVKTDLDLKGDLAYDVTEHFDNGGDATVTI